MAKMKKIAGGWYRRADINCTLLVNWKNIFLKC